MLVLRMATWRNRGSMRSMGDAASKDAVRQHMQAGDDRYQSIHDGMMLPWTL